MRYSGRQATRPVRAGGDDWRRDRDEMAEIDGRMAAIRREVERRRFAGDDPELVLKPRLAQAEIVALTLAAERAGTALTIGELRYHPGADLAEEALHEAVAALRTWGFSAARGRLDEAARRAVDPPTQQRATLFKALIRHFSAIIYVPLHEKLRLGLADLDEAMQGLDLLPRAEFVHYRDEIDRLIALREAAAEGDPFLAAAWTLIRAQLAINGGQDEAALLWLLRLAAAHRLGPEGGSTGYLVELVERARAQLLATIVPLAEGETAPDTPEAVRPRELFNAIVARLGADLGRDLTQGLGRFTLTEYTPTDLAPTAGGASAPPRRVGTRG